QSPSSMSAAAADASSDEARLERVRRQLSDAGQLHLLDGWPSLSGEQRVRLLRQLERIDWPGLSAAVRAVMSGQPPRLGEGYAPPPASVCAGPGGPRDSELRAAGLAAVAEGRVGLVLVAGGQATRLGATGPKGAYNVGLPSGKSLFQLHAEKALRVEAMAGGGPGRIAWYVMTSDSTGPGTEALFRGAGCFGLRPDCVRFFEQGSVPCVDTDGRALMAGPDAVQTSPDGNGGLYRALRESGALADMRRRGIACLQVFGVDNILTRVADPLFIGHCLLERVSMAAKVVERTRPEERVGVVAADTASGGYRVVEYSEMRPEDAAAREPDGQRLLMRAANICQHYFTLESLESVCQPENEVRLLPYHAAKKKVPYWDANAGQMVHSPPTENAIKFEKFVFDVFPAAGSSFALWEAARSEEFSPLKNAPGSSSDCPETCRRDVLELHTKWLLTAASASSLGGSRRYAEVSPLLSYAGEGLEGVDLSGNPPEGLLFVDE
ncbi:hypothetical protein BOX15_Mlig006292g3, partial [Macrostomum lignano]